MSLSQRWLQAAYQGSLWLTPLRPLGALYGWVMKRRYQAYAGGKRDVWQAPVPVIVVGNITLGGTGKSPIVAWLVRWLKGQGYTPGIVARGYGGKAAQYPLIVTADTDVTQSGDEPLMLAQQTGVPVVADPLRARGARQLIEFGCDVIVSDDGLQHLALGRDIELALMDGHWGLGNRRCLPAGPLREPASRLEQVDVVLVNGAPSHQTPENATLMQLAPTAWRHLASGEQKPLTPLPFNLPVNAIAGIGRPERFFETLASLGVNGCWYSFDDHYPFEASSLQFTGQEAARPLLMTAKDAVKCRNIAPPDSWVLDVEARLPPEFERWLAERLATLSARRRTDG